MEHPIDVLGIFTYMKTHEFFQPLMQVNVSQSQQSHMGWDGWKIVFPLKSSSKTCRKVTQQPRRLPQLACVWGHLKAVVTTGRVQHSMATGWLPKGSCWTIVKPIFHIV